MYPAEQPAQQPAEQSQPDREWLTLPEAAARLGVSVDTIRRRIKRGELLAEQVATQQGQRLRVCLADAEQTRHRIVRSTIAPTLLYQRRSAWKHKRRRMRAQRPARDGEHCANCGTALDLTVDHLTSLAHGGSSDLDNLQLLCTSCNARKNAPVVEVRTEPVMHGTPSNVRSKADSAPGSAHSFDEAPHLAALVRDLQRQNIELAGLVGSLQQRLSFADDRIRALEAPKETASQERPFLRDSEGVAVEPPQTPAEHRNGRPWWRFWRG